ncbi:hypothetical protein IWQ57_000905 [Coemansia nantahalensis]|uniref:Uncharacterized protein n=1 Tax=Coemansia nantahalensis TaxID=2789366 RepID=A0ACC1K5Z1_9FUNG|nr:hypothetical protein IWQ57_000905 [Coemansia nantahalensis]
MDARQLAVFGYSARLFPAQDTSHRYAGLVELAAGGGAPLHVDRYDVRHLLPQPLHVTDCASADLADPEPSVARFAALDDAAVPEHEVFRMSSVGRKGYIADIRQRPRSDASDSGGAAVALSYDKQGIPHLGSPAGGAATAAFVPPFAVPDGMAVPETRRHFEIVQHTARFIADQPAHRAGQMEIVIQGKQGTNADFAFLHRGSTLHPFYQHMLWLLRTGLFAYNADAPSPRSSAPSSPSPAPPSPGPGPGPESSGPPAAAPPSSPPGQETRELQAKRRRLAAVFLRRKRADAT